MNQGIKQSRNQRREYIQGINTTNQGIKGSVSGINTRNQYKESMQESWSQEISATNLYKSPIQGTKESKNECITERRIQGIQDAKQ